MSRFIIDGYNRIRMLLRFNMFIAGTFTFRLE